MKPQLRPGDDLIARTKAAARIKRAKWNPRSAASPHGFPLRPVMIGTAVCAAAAVIALPVLFAASRRGNILSAAGSLSSEESGSAAAHTIAYSELKLPEGGEFVLPEGAAGIPIETLDIPKFHETDAINADFIIDAVVTDGEFVTRTDSFGVSYTSLIYSLEARSFGKIGGGTVAPPKKAEVPCYTMNGKLYQSLKKGHRYVLFLSDSETISGDAQRENRYTLFNPFIPSIEITDEPVNTQKYIFPGDFWESLCTEDALRITGGEWEDLYLRSGSNGFWTELLNLLDRYYILKHHQTETLSEEKRQKIKEDYFNALPKEERPNSPEGIMIYDYCGVYEGAELVLVAKTETGFECMLEGFSIDGYSFRMPYPGYRLHSGSSFYEIAEAYKQGIITEKSLRELQRRYGTESTTTPSTSEAITSTTPADRPPRSTTTTEAALSNTTSERQATPTTCFYGSASIMKFSTLAEYKEALLPLSNKEALYQAFLKSAKISHLSLNESEFEMLLTDRYFILPVLPAGSTLSKVEFLCNGTTDFYVTLSDGNSLRFTCWHGKKELWSPEGSKKTSMNNAHGLSIVHDHVQYAFPVDDTIIDMNYGFYTWKVGDYFCRMPYEGDALDSYDAFLKELSFEKICF